MHPGRQLTPLATVLLGFFASPIVAQTGFGGMGGFGSGMGLPSSLNSGSGASQAIGINPFASVMAAYSHEFGVTDVSRDTLSGTAVLGISGAKSYEHTALSLSLVGTGNYQPRYNLNRWSQSYASTLAVSHAVNSRLSLSGSELAGSALGGFGLGAGLSGFGSLGGLGGMMSGLTDGLGPGVLPSAAVNGLVDAEISNGRTNFAATSGGLNYRLSERWVTTANGGAAWVGRQGGFFDERMNQAGGGLNYLFNRRTSLGVQYGHSWINYSSAYGGARTQILGLQFESRPNNHSSYGLFAGVGNLSSAFIGLVSVPAEVAALLGASASYEQRKIQYYTGSFGGRYSYGRGHHSVSALANRGFVPGNGALLAGVRDSAGLNYALSGVTKVGISAGVFGSRTSAVFGPRGVITTYQFSLGTGFHIIGPFSFSVSAGYRVLSAPAGQEQRGFIVSTGITWSPRPTPMVL